MAQPSSARVGRHWVMRVVRATGVPSHAWDLIELLTGELLANAVVHGPDRGDIRVRTWFADHVVNVAVSDESATRPVVRSAPPTASSGRGMMLIDTLSSAWGVDDRGADGKTVWFSLDVGAV